MHRDEPAAMSIDDRLDEVASLLATRFLRLTGGGMSDHAGLAGEARPPLCEGGVYVREAGR
jgi:hypothetical protein